MVPPDQPDQSFFRSIHKLVVALTDLASVVAAEYRIRMTLIDRPELSQRELFREPLVYVQHMEATVVVNARGDTFNTGGGDAAKVTTGDVTDSSVAVQSTQHVGVGQVEIVKVFEAMLKAMKEMPEEHRWMAVAATQQLEAEAKKPPDQRNPSVLKQAWTYLTGALGAVSAANSIATHWPAWSKALTEYFSHGGSDPFV